MGSEGEVLAWFKPYTSEEVAEHRRYVKSRAARDHWSASELDLVDRNARWLATLDAETARADAAEARVRELEKVADAARDVLKHLPEIALRQALGDLDRLES